MPLAGAQAERHGASVTETAKSIVGAFVMASHMGLTAACIEEQLASQRPHASASASSGRAKRKAGAVVAGDSAHRSAGGARAPDGADVQHSADVKYLLAKQPLIRECMRLERQQAQQLHKLLAGSGSGSASALRSEGPIADIALQPPTDGVLGSSADKAARGSGQPAPLLSSDHLLLVRNTLMAMSWQQVITLQTGLVKPLAGVNAAAKHLREVGRSSGPVDGAVGTSRSRSAGASGLAGHWSHLHAEMVQAAELARALLEHTVAAMGAQLSWVARATADAAPLPLPLTLHAPLPGLGASGLALAAQLLVQATTQVGTKVCARSCMHACIEGCSIPLCMVATWHIGMHR